jgi:hypothetical protein
MTAEAADMWLIGVDDTDMPDTRGTGHLARSLAEDLAGRGLRALGITRHQLLVHPAVRYTSHNSSNCLAVEGSEASADGLFARACEFVAARSAQGADPGVCVVRADAVGPSVVEFGRRAQREVLQRGEAEALAAREGCRLAGLAGTREGVIGALAAVGLRAGGNDGRFIALGGIRDLGGVVPVQALLDAGIAAVLCPGECPPGPSDRVETLGWVRPRLVEGRAALLVERSQDDGVDWTVADRRSSRKGHGG